MVEDAPNLAGENLLYLKAQLEAFRSGKRASEVMGPVAGALTDAEMDTAAQWYSAIGLEVPAP